MDSAHWPSMTISWQIPFNFCCYSDGRIQADSLGLYSNFSVVWAIINNLVLSINFNIFSVSLYKVLPDFHCNWKKFMDQVKKHWNICFVQFLLSIHGMTNYLNILQFLKTVLKNFQHKRPFQFTCKCSVCMFFVCVSIGAINAHIYKYNWFLYLYLKALLVLEVFLCFILVDSECLLCR